ncbi:hypothetical protein PR048_010428 [Dryococelus australis]|uniref:Uncharacterized protein n=1 Tax=Dryococelus australis TaxID=614101 RepID=A0ABQ9I3T8_9NEOP|nr:hypothetical protein PR048_010428 [Dryococelus australis]
MEQRRNEMAKETGDTHENPPTSGVVRHYSSMRKSGIVEWMSFGDRRLARREARGERNDQPGGGGSATTSTNAVKGATGRLDYWTELHSQFDRRRRQLNCRLGDGERSIHRGGGRDIGRRHLTTRGMKPQTSQRLALGDRKNLSIRMHDLVKEIGASAHDGRDHTFRCFTQLLSRRVKEKTIHYSAPSGTETTLARRGRVSEPVLRHLAPFSRADAFAKRWPESYGFPPAPARRQGLLAPSSNASRPTKPHLPSPQRNACPHSQRGGEEGVGSHIHAQERRPPVFIPPPRAADRSCVSSCREGASRRGERNCSALHFSLLLAGSYCQNW